MFDTQHMSSSNVDYMQCFWDPDIIEDSADDPRNKIFHASPLRKRREEKAFEVGELVNGDEFE